jgi:predicted amidophosphoribosyltransferase
MLEIEGRCKKCFHSDNMTPYGCRHCRQSPSFFLRQGAVFEEGGPASTLLAMLKRGHPYLAKGLGAYLYAQFLHLNWPVPDVIIPVPSFFNKATSSRLLAKELGKYLHVPLIDGLKKKGGTFRQSGQTLDQRKQLGQPFTLKKTVRLEDKMVLLIDDCVVSGATLQRCGEAIAAGYPSNIYALSVTKYIN